LIILIALAATCGEITADQPAPSAAQAPMPKELTQLITLEDFHEMRLVQLLDRLTKRTGIRIDLDESGLEKLCKKPLKDVTIVPPPGSLPLGAAVEFVASQVHGTLRERNRRWRIVPGRADISRFVSPPTEATHKATQKMAEIERPIQGAPARDIVEFLSEKYERRIVIAPGTIENPAKLGDKMCQLPVSKKSLIGLVRDVARQLQGEVQIYKEFILIAPPDRSQP
jgi:hypothetical protein